MSKAGKSWRPGYVSSKYFKNSLKNIYEFKFDQHWKGKLKEKKGHLKLNVLLASHKIPLIFMSGTPLPQFWQKKRGLYSQFILCLE